MRCLRFDSACDPDNCCGGRNRKGEPSKRLAVTYPEHNPDLPVVCVDFDGMLASNTWPSPRLGQADHAAIRLVQHYSELGCEVHILTARPESHLPRIWKWLEGQQIEFLVYDVTNRKPPACLYFDDRAVRWPLG